VDPDAVVWDAIRAADDDAFAQLYDRYASDVYNFAFRRTASWLAAEEVVADTFAVVWQRARQGTLAPLTRPSALPFLLAVAINQGANGARSDRRWRAAVRRGAATQDRPHHEDHADDVASRLDDEARMRQVRTALQALPRRQREAVELVAWAGLSSADAAAVLGVPIGTVKSRLSRARAALTEMCEDPEGDQIHDR
jgi:RNA polymerase sigma-70 factor (ECF subfamily)